MNPFKDVQDAERRSSAETSISGRGMESNAWEGSRLGPSHSKRQSRPAQLRNLNSQLSSKLSDSIGVHASSDQGFMQATPRSRPVRNSFSIESRLRAGELPVDLLRQKSQRESLLDLLKQRAGSQELSSQGLTSLLNAPTSNTTNQQTGTLGSTWWPFSGGPDLPLVVPPPDPNRLPNIDLSSFHGYLQSHSTRLSRFEAACSAKQADVSREDDREFTPGDGLVQAMQVVPTMFFKEDFSLARPETWQEVLSTEDEDQRLARVEGYNNYVDIVESQLGQEIAALQEHSTEFFRASSFLEDLRRSIYRAYSQVKDVRQHLHQVKVETEASASDVVRLKQRKANLESIMSKLKVVEEVATAQNTIELLLPQGDFAGALDVLESIKTILTAHPVTSLHAFRHLPSQLADIAEAIDDLLSSEFLRVTHFQRQMAVIADIASRLGEDLSEGALAETAGVEAAGLEDELTPLVLGLNRTGHLLPAIRVLRSSASEEIKSGIREVVELVLERFQQQELVGAGMTERLQHLKLIATTLNKILKASKVTRGVINGVAQEFAEVQQAVNEAAHSRWIKLLASRSFLVASLDTDSLRRLLEQSDKFGAAMQQTGCRPIPALRNATLIQGRAYLESKHASSLAQLTTALECETWLAVEVSQSSQAVITGILHQADFASTMAVTKAAQKEGSAGKLHVASRSFSTVSCQLLLLRLLEEYLSFLNTIPSLALEAAHRVVELVKVFNSRMCQLVLGAGAMQVAGLKSITAKHLALSCQCVGILIELHPSLVAAMSSKLPVSHRALLAPEFNLMLQDLTVHRGEIHNKLVGIMRERLIASLKQLPNIAARWETSSSVTQPSPFSQNLVKQLRTLSQVVSPLLLEEELQAVFSRLGSLYSKNLAEAFSRIETLGSSWRHQAALDLKYLVEALGELPMVATQKEPALERLTHLLQTRFAIEEEAVSSTSQPPDPTVQPTLATAARKSLVDRLNHTKLPFFNRERGTALDSSSSTERNINTASEGKPSEPFAKEVESDRSIEENLSNGSPDQNDSQQPGFTVLATSEISVPAEGRRNELNSTPPAEESWMPPEPLRDSAASAGSGTALPDRGAETDQPEAQLMLASGSGGESQEGPASISQDPYYLATNALYSEREANEVGLAGAADHSLSDNRPEAFSRVSNGAISQRTISPGEVIADLAVADATDHFQPGNSLTTQSVPASAEPVIPPADPPTLEDWARLTPVEQLPMPSSMDAFETRAGSRVAYSPDSVLARPAKSPLSKILGTELGTDSVRQEIGEAALVETTRAADDLMAHAAQESRQSAGPSYIQETPPAVSNPGLEDATSTTQDFLLCPEPQKDVEGYAAQLEKPVETSGGRRDKIGFRAKESTSRQDLLFLVEPDKVPVRGSAGAIRDMLKTVEREEWSYDNLQ